MSNLEVERALRRRPWILLERLDPELQAAVRGLGIGHSRGGFGAWCFDFFVPENIRNELAIQAFAAYGLDETTPAAHLICYSAGEQYAVAVQDLRDGGFIPCERAGSLREECRVFAQGRTFWNSPQ